MSTAVGETPGLYGGTRNTSSCNREQLVKFLNSHPAQANAWINAQNADSNLRYSGGKLTRSNLPLYIRSLTPLVLRYDTYLTNHGFNNNKANPIPEFLEAGNAVLVDRYGVPRARCSCGNPLTPATGHKNTTVQFQGTAWTGFNPNEAHVVTPAPKPVVKFTVVDEKGQIFDRPAGTTGTQDKKVATSVPTPTFSPSSLPTPAASTVPATTAPAATTDAPAATYDEAFNRTFGFTPPKGYVTRTDGTFTGYPNIPVIEVAEHSTDDWENPTAKPSEAGFSVSDLSGGKVSDPDLFFKQVFEGLKRSGCPTGTQGDVIYETSTRWKGYDQEIGPCTDTNPEQITSLIKVTDQTTQDTLLFLVRGPASTFSATRDLALRSLETFTR